MNTTLALTHLSRQPATDTGAPPPLLLLLHGVGSNEADLFTLAPQLDPRLLVLSARAPYPRAPGSYAWFAVEFTPNGPQIDPAQAEASRRALIQFIDQAVQHYGADPGQVYLIGFSQGAIMSASVALSEPERVAGAVLMSGRILPEIRPQIAAPERLAGLPLLVVHGIEDTVLPIQHGRASRELLSGLPLALTYREYPIGHTVGRSSLADVAAWLSARLDAASRRELPT